MSELHEAAASGDLDALEEALKKQGERCGR